MLIERFEVEEGFLNGLRLDFRPGLNVLVGPRGTGKTSIVELIRFCLKAPAFTEEAEREARQHALDVLGTGRVTLTVSQDGQRTTVSRAAGDREPRQAAPLPLLGVTILSQKEIEKIGLDATGRLRLLDDFSQASGETSRSEAQALESLRSLTIQLAQVTTTVSGLKESLAEMRVLDVQLDAARQDEAEFQGALAQHAEEQAELLALSDELVVLAHRDATLAEGAVRLEAWATRLRAAIAGTPSLPGWPSEAGPVDSLSEARVLVSAVRESLDVQLTNLSRVVGAIRASEATVRHRHAEASDTARQLRRVLDAVAEGAGAAAARVGSLREEIARRQALQGQLAEQQEVMNRLQSVRRDWLDHLDEVREAKYERRLAVASQLNDTLGPRIKIGVIRYGHQAQYASAVGAALRGSRLHYNQLAVVLAGALSPRELVEAAERDDVEFVTNTADLDKERTERILQAIREDGGASILASPLEDAVQLYLLDGAEYKPSENLSTGQRCTVVLPLLLEQRARGLIVDQPEDHLDNGFIVDSVVKAIRSRPPQDQLIVASHNANIPVLGEASLVIVLASDGRTAHVASCAELDAPKSVEAITRIMEGGRDAFERRGAFYQSHGD